MAVSVETLGRVVRSAWVDWARRQPNPKLSWLEPWEALSEEDREADRCIGAAVYDFVSRETSEPAPLLFWRVCADDSDMAPRDKIKWLTASYTHCQMYAGLSMPADLIDRRIGVAAVMARLTDQLLAMAGADGEIDKFIVKWLCFACDQLWEYVPAEKRDMPDPVDPDNPVYSAWIGEINRRMPGLVATKGDPNFAGRVGDQLVIICPACQTWHMYPPAHSICHQCSAPLTHIQPLPYPVAVAYKHDPAL